MFNKYIWLLASGLIAVDLVLWYWSHMKAVAPMGPNAKTSNMSSVVHSLRQHSLAIGIISINTVVVAAGLGLSAWFNHSDITNASSSLSRQINDSAISVKAELGQDMDGLAIKIASLREDVAALRDQTSGTGGAAAGLPSDIERLHAQVNSLMAQLAAKENESNSSKESLQVFLHGMQNGVLSAQHSVSIMREKVVDLKRSNADSSLTTSFEKKLADLDTQLAGLQETLKRYQ